VGIGDLKERFVSHRGRRPAIVCRPLISVRSASRDSELNSPFDIEPVHHRWLLTTCAAGIAGSLLVGGAVLSIFGQNAAPRDAFAAVRKSEQTAAPLFKGDAGGQIEQVALRSFKELSDAYQPPGDQPVVPERDFSGDNLYPRINSGELPYGAGKPFVLDAEIQAVETESANITTISKTPPAEPIDETFKLAKGRTLIDELVDRGVTKDAAQALVAAIEPILPATMMRAGTEFELTLDRQQDFYGRDVTYPVELSFKPGPNETIKVEADEDGRFVASIAGVKGASKSQYARYNHFRTKSQVGSSLYSTAKDNKVPDYIVAELTRVFAYDVDFQRQVKASDSFEVFYGNPLTGTSSKRKVLHFAQLTLSGKTRTLFRYTTADGQTDYFDENGRGATKSLLRTPVSGARLTSGYGMRRHPLLGYSKMHTGVDFGAPSGTPIRAAGAGMIELAGRHGAYGVTIKIQHAGKYETLYAHMSKLAAGIRPGSKVNQGQIIGYVGSTGRATGPHLHYEVRIADRAVNPTRIKSAGGKQLAGKELTRFRQLKQRVLAMMMTAPSALQVAQVSR
jgi:murein DD-endopeptidase MepM/ murein hydrolase activator NlpD